MAKNVNQVTQACFRWKFGAIPDGVPLDREVVELAEWVREHEMFFGRQARVVDGPIVLFDLRMI